MSPKGKVVPAVPTPARPKSTIDWDGPALLAKMTGQPVLAAEHVANSRVKSLRQYTRAPFVDETGRISVMLRNSKLDERDGKRYGDVYFRWIPNTTKKESK